MFLRSSTEITFGSSIKEPLEINLEEIKFQVVSDYMSLFCLYLPYKASNGARL